MSGETGMSAREVILARIREALRVPAPLPHGLTAESQSQVGQRYPRAAVTPYCPRKWPGRGCPMAARRRPNGCSF